MDIQLFRTHFTAFKDDAVYPDDTIKFWSDLAEKLLSKCRFGKVWTEAVELFTAHNLALEKNNEYTAEDGGVPGLGSTMETSKSVGSASVSYDVGTITDPNAGIWNETNYGRRYAMLMRLAGMGVKQY